VTGQRQARARPTAGPGQQPSALQDPVSVALLTAPIPLRLAYTASDGWPRVVPVWSHWDGRDLVVGVFPGSAKLRSLHHGDRVAGTLDTQDYPYQALQVRGPTSLSATPGLVPEYVLAAQRHLGPERAAGFLARLHGRPMVRLAVHVDHARLLDLRR